MQDRLEVSKVNDLIFDIGMHKGEDTDFYLKRGFRVIAFEANPDMIAFCERRFDHFLANGKLIIVGGAIIGSKDLIPGQETVKFYKNNSLSVWGTVCTDWAERNIHRGTTSTVVEVPVINFTSIIQKYGMPHYMKIDIEGCDIICIEALKQFQVVPDYISLESSKTSFSQIKEEVEMLSELGYLSFQAVEQSSIPHTQKWIGEYMEHTFEEGSSGLFGADLPNCWKTKDEILSQYRVVSLGYKLLGDFGLLNSWKFPGSFLFRGVTRRAIQFLTKAPVPGWYDTHAALALPATDRIRR
ncbi:FkbM family methyltransferase [Thermostichus vulcanus]|uniref:FkbM family methyltransferase n=1 Tax=Thermostichus vulcanus str. 'Rupite' TaxID=2813851 RepID=A0ABT0C6E2_THEVL|nr:FkbM family methyltransferase [Thermostichus vulcanus]MCJ2541348.1 FkbM family methyltransferase [Thermostichus vulcanus str. 'Rupite']